MEDIFTSIGALVLLISCIAGVFIFAYMEFKRTTKLTEKRTMQLDNIIAALEECARNQNSIIEYTCLKSITKEEMDDLRTLIYKFRSHENFDK